MSMILYRIGTYLALLCLGIFFYTQAAVAPVAPDLSQVETVPGAAVSLSDAAQEALTGPFQAQAAFAAFAVGSAGQFEWVAGRLSPEDARRDALAACTAGGGGCVIVAERRPKDDPAAATVTTVSQ